LLARQLPKEKHTCGRTIKAFASIKIIVEILQQLEHPYINNDMRAPRAGTTVVRKTFPIAATSYLGDAEEFLL
jgi:hypothetical protein